MITAGTNSRIKRLVQLNQKAKIRRQEDVFVAEGVRMFLEAPLSKIREVYVSESFRGGDLCAQKLESTGYEVVEDSLFKKISDTCTPQGILCVTGQFHYRQEQLLRKKNPLLLLLENIQDPGNLGTMFRTAEAAGADGIIMSRDTVDVYNPKVIRSTMGSIFRMPFFYAQDLRETAAFLRRSGVRVYAAHLGGKRFYTEAAYLEGAAFLIGNEGNGLLEETVRAADQILRIPMEGEVESLNAAVSAAVLLYEASRQRRQTGNGAKGK